MRRLVVFERAQENYAAYVPGQTLAEARRGIREAIEFRIERLLAERLPVPPATANARDAGR